MSDERMIGLGLAGAHSQDLPTLVQEAKEEAGFYSISVGDNVDGCK